MATEETSARELIANRLTALRAVREEHTRKATIRDAALAAGIFELEQLLDLLRDAAAGSQPPVEADLRAEGWQRVDAGADDA
jgi:hypothetical protein